jgi:hypothetical protein
LQALHGRLGPVWPDIVVSIREMASKEKGIGTLEQKKEQKKAGPGKDLPVHDCAV